VAAAAKFKGPNHPRSDSGGTASEAGGGMSAKREVREFAAAATNTKLIVQIVVDVGDDADLLDLRSAGITVLDRESALAGRLDLAELAV